LEGTAARGRWGSEREHGQALVEFVVVLPVFLLIVFAVVEFGLAYNYWIDTTHLANEGARYAAVDARPSCNGTPCHLREYLRLRANTKELRLGDADVAGSGLGPAPPALPGQSYGDATTPNIDDGIVICFPDSAPVVGGPVQVIVKTRYELAVVDGLFSALGMDTVGEIDLQASTTMRLEQPPAQLAVESVGPCP
jgi:TadE-like protein